MRRITRKKHREEVHHVSSKEELDEAYRRGWKNIQVVGKLAGQLYRTQKLMRLSPLALGGLVGSLSLAPATGGLSMLVGAVPTMGMSGVSIGALILAASIGVSLILGVFNNYEVVEFENGRLTLRKKE